MTEHNHIHYRIQRVCLDMTVDSTFATPDDGMISYKEYFLRRHGLKLDPLAPMLHCPFRGKQELYLPAQLATLTGLDEDWRTDREFAQDLWRGLRYEPDEHWKMQSRLTDALAQQKEAGNSPLQEWGIEVGKEPIEAELKMLHRDAVYFSRQANDMFKQGRQPPRNLEVPVSHDGFVEKPWPDVWTPGNSRIVLDRWIIFRAKGEDEAQSVTAFVDELSPLVGQLLEADRDDRIMISSPHVVSVPGNTAEHWTEFIKQYVPPWKPTDTKLVCVIIPAQVRRRDQYYYQLKDLLFFQQSTGVLSQMMLSSTLQRTQQRQQIWKNILQQLLIKQGAFMWVISPLPYCGRVHMVVGIDACKQSKDSPCIQTLCASTNPYFTSYFTTWRTCTTENFAPLSGAMLKEAIVYNYTHGGGRLPETIIIYRGGVSESQETALIQGEVLQPEDGILESLRSLPQEVGLSAEDAEEWRSKLEIAYILVRRGTNARFRTKDYENLQSGSYIDNSVVASSTTRGIPLELQRFDFYMVSQTYVIGTAKPTLYSVLYSTLSMPRQELITLCYRLCGVYMTFPGLVSMPAPLKYACKLLSLLSKCESVPAEPTAGVERLRTSLFFV